jgi:hypothetical protein
MRLSIQTAVWLTAGLIFRAIIAQDLSPGGPVHPGQPENCNGWHTIISGDNCQNVSQRYGISLQQFLAWNPAVSSDCRNNFWLESAYCVRVGTSSSKPSTSTSTPTSNAKLSSTSKATSRTTSSAATTKSSVARTSTNSRSITSYNSTYSALHPVTSWNITATSTDKTWPPTKTLAGQISICNAWHRVIPGDTCQRLVSKFGLRSIEDFLSWNPAAKEDCEMLIADYYVCISVQRQLGNTDLEWDTAQPEFTEPPEPTEYTSVTRPPADSSFTPSPSHGPMPSNCKVFHKAAANQNCNDLVNSYGYFSQEQFLTWNPALNGNCLGLWLDTWYCVGAYSDNDLPLPAHRATKPTEGNTPSGYPGDCTRWYQTTDDDTCDLIALMFGSFSPVDFRNWNPSVFGDCSGIVPKAWYCVGRPGTPTTRTAGAPSPTHQIPSTRPTQSGISAACTSFWLVGATDTCHSIARQAGISRDDFHSWNRAIATGSCAGLAADYYVCVAVGDQGSSSQRPNETRTSQTAPSTRSMATTRLTITSSRPITTTTAASGPVHTPSPVRENMAKNCVRFHLQQPDEFCGAMASDAGIPLA